MGAAVNGLALHGGIVKPYGLTFLVFSDYMRPAIRMSALMRLPVVWVFTHDSIGVGEDGPTHQPVEHYAALRAIPGLTVIRPATPTRPSRHGASRSRPTAGRCACCSPARTYQSSGPRKKRRQLAFPGERTCWPTLPRR